MGNYYSTIETRNNKFVGFVYIESTNQLIFQTEPHISQTRVLEDINTFITTNKPAGDSVPVMPGKIPTQTITNTIKSTSNVPLPVVRGRCCGR